MKKLLTVAAACVLVIIASILLLQGIKSKETTTSAPSDIIVYPDEATAATVNGYLDISKLNSPVSDYYYANTSTKIFHKSNCKYAERISPNKLYLERDRDSLISDGYSPCYNCNP